MATAAMGGRITAPGVRQLVPLPWPGGPLSRLRHDPPGFLLGEMSRHGDVFRSRSGPLLFRQGAHPDHVRKLLRDNANNDPRSWYYRRTKAVVGVEL